MRHSFGALLILTAVFFLAACMPAQRTPVQTVQTVKPALTGTRWQLVYVKDSNLTPPQQAHLVFENKDTPRVYGSDGCNRFVGAYAVQDNRLRFGTIATTRMICPNIQTAKKFFTYLERVNRYVLRDTTLRLKEDAIVLLEFNATFTP